ncbi:MAG: PcfB family protein [Eubacteriales bacterium]|nr:PcfB family protein [Eubacteriales bacterium]
MQEEVEQRVVTLIVNCSKLTEQELRKALSKLLAQMKNHRQNKQPHGKMTVKQLAAQNRGMQSVEVTDQNIGSFTRIARKYGIDFAPFKAKDQDRYLIFFKSQDADAMTAAFKEYTAQTVKKHSRPSVLAKLEKFKSLIQSAVVDRTRKKELER